MSQLQFGSAQALCSLTVDGLVEAQKNQTVLDAGNTFGLKWSSNNSLLSFWLLAF